MKYLAIMGSFRKNKNSNQALDAFLQGVEKNGHEVEKLYLRDMDIKNCTGCDNCSRTGHCVFKDDMNIIYNHLDNCDAIVVSAPIYFNSINALTKTMVDRSQRYWGIKYGYGREKIEIPRKIGMFIGIGGANYTYDQFLAGQLVMDMFFKSINAEFRGNYLISETDKGEVSTKNRIVEELIEIGENFENLSKFSIQKID
ncbi:MAG: flavodoxin family protein [Tissierellia bacterium]|nr:flavodoxin family protein [Tissierellia bacterium]